PAPASDPPPVAESTAPAARATASHRKIHPTRDALATVPFAPPATDGRPASTPPTLFSPTTPTLPYQGGPVMGGTKNVYIVWYGSWTHPAGGTIDIVQDFVKNLGGSPYFKIN